MRNLGFTLILLVAFASPGLTQQHGKRTKASAHAAATKAPDKALMDAIWAAWTSGNLANVTKYYAKGTHVFYDIAPLKYGSWAEYEKGSEQLLAGFQSIQVRVNNDAEIHRHGNLAWGTATVHHVDVMKNGNKGEGDFRWTVIWEKNGPEWLIVHEHVSAPLGGAGE